LTLQKSLCKLQSELEVKLVTTSAKPPVVHLLKIVITGFNTDIEYEGVVYHVQTEDKGLDSPLILSLVYSGGAILASKRSRYEDLIEAGFKEEVLTQRLQRQHRLICAAINAGRLEDLKRMGGKQQAEVEAEVTSQLDAPTPEIELFSGSIYEEMEFVNAGRVVAEPAVVELTVPEEDLTIEEPGPALDETISDRPASAYTVHDSRRDTSDREIVNAEAGVVLTILEEAEFRAGEDFTIRIMLEDSSGPRPKPLPGIQISIKVLGTTFRPQIYSVKTQPNGVATLPVTMPGFTSGRAAVLIRAVAKGESLEARRVILPAA
jgi:hypothetical protein